MVTELDERMHNLKNELQSLDGEENDESNKKKAIEALKRMESWNLFSDTHEVYHLVIWWGLLCFSFFFPFWFIMLKDRY